jgi:hypothetical protein
MDVKPLRLVRVYPTQEWFAGDGRDRGAAYRRATTTWVEFEGFPADMFVRLTPETYDRTDVPMYTEAGWCLSHYACSHN